VTFSGAVSPNTCTLSSTPTCSGLNDACPNGKGDCCAGLKCVDNSATDHRKVCKGSGPTAQQGQSCTGSTTVDSFGNCQVACPSGSTLIDVVPIDMTTEVVFTVPTGGGGGGAVAAAAQSSFQCPDFSSQCVIDQHCTIGASAIQYQAIKEYTCTVTYVGATSP
jgi:hypothetical protein